VITALGIGWISRRQTIREDTAIGVLFSGMFSLGIVLISRAGSFRDFSHMLFGNILGVTTGDLIGIAVVSLLVAGSLLLLQKELTLTTVDPLHGEVIGLSAERMRYALLVLLALAVVTGIQAVGVALPGDRQWRGDCVVMHGDLWVGVSHHTAPFRSTGFEAASDHENPQGKRGDLLRRMTPRVLGHGRFRNRKRSILHWRLSSAWRTQVS